MHKLDDWLDGFVSDVALERKADRVLLVFLTVVFVLFLLRGVLGAHVSAGQGPRDSEGLEISAAALSVE